MCVYWSRNVCATAPRLSWDALQRAQFDPPLCWRVRVFVLCAVRESELSGGWSVARGPASAPAPLGVLAAASAVAQA